MASGKSCSAQNPEGVRRTVNGKTLAPRSKRKVEITVETEMRWDPFSETRAPRPVERRTSKVFLD